MEDINKYTGNKIRNYRKMKQLTLQQLADRIHKSRATVSKYENGEIALDLPTLYDICGALEVRMEQLCDYHQENNEEENLDMVGYRGKSPFFKADRLFFYFYDGRYHRLKEAVIDIHKHTLLEDGCYEASMFIQSSTPTGRSSEIYYTGKVLYSDMLIRFSFVNKYNKLEQDLLYIFNPLELRTTTEGLLCGISSVDLMPCAFKCIVSLAASDDYEHLQEALMITPKELRRWKNLNMFTVDNHS